MPSFRILSEFLSLDIVMELPGCSQKQKYKKFGREWHPRVADISHRHYSGLWLNRESLPASAECPGLTEGKNSAPGNKQKWPHSRLFNKI
jgi:lysozyme family protein